MRTVRPGGELGFPVLQGGPGGAVALGVRRDAPEHERREEPRLRERPAAAQVALRVVRERGEDAFQVVAQGARDAPALRHVGRDHDAAHEFGGRYKRERYPKRPLMGPSLKESVPRLARMWQDAVK